MTPPLINYHISSQWGKSMGTCLVRQAVRCRGPELAAEERSVLIAEETALSMERPYGGQA